MRELFREIKGKSRFQTRSADERVWNDIFYVFEFFCSLQFLRELLRSGK